VRPELVPRLRCPACRAGGALSLDAAERDAREVRGGSLSCARCGHVAPVAGGIADLLHDPPEFVVREAAGLGRFADLMRSDGWTRADVLALPYREGDGYWYAQRVLMEQVLETTPFAAGETLLDVGSNTCWASAMFAARGLDVTALDICEHEMQGLRTADWQFAAKDVYFDRVMGVMFDLPFADASFKWVWACEVLHHNHRENLARTYEEIHRVLEPGGSLIVANEPLRNLRTPKLRPGHEVAEFEGHEHAYMRHSYTSLARRAGFEVRVLGPRYHGTQRDERFVLHEGLSVPRLYLMATAVAVRKSPRLKAAVLAARSFLLGGTALHMVCTKPAG
jgi:SAM-dependent methyltransferase